MRTMLFAILAASTLAASPAIAADPGPLAGTWKLRSFVVQNLDTNETLRPLGEQPRGFMIITRGGHHMEVLTAGARPVPQSDEDRVANFRTMFAYTGPITLEPGAFTISVQAAWNEGWAGGEQKRFYVLEGNDRLKVETPPVAGPNTGLRNVKAMIEYERAEQQRARPTFAAPPVPRSRPSPSARTPR